MKVNLIALLIFFLGCQLLFAASGKGQDIAETKITLELHNVTLKTALNKIGGLSGFKMVFPTEQITKYKNIKLEKSSRTVEQTLELILVNTTLDFKQVNQSIVVFKRESAEKKAEAIEIVALPPPPIEVHGRITDSAGNPLSGAAIKVKGSSNGTVTDETGEFIIKGVGNTDVLVISFVGYGTREIAVNGRTTITASLKMTSQQLADFSVQVSTGYQTLPKERATGSFAYVDNQLLNRRVSTDVISKLEGVVPGLLFNRNTVNSANGLADISIRGHSTLFANDQPLIVVDGFPYDGDINNINPNDVQDISVLKDAAAASIWGVRSGNGVIVITTKKGKTGQKLAVEFNSNITIGNRPNVFYNPNFMASGDFIDIEKKLFSLGYYDADLTNPAMPPVSPVVEILAKERAGQLTTQEAEAQISSLSNIDVRNDISKYLYQKSVDQQYAINLHGGTNNNAYFFSTGYDNNLSNATGNKYERITLNGLNTFYPARNLEITAGLSITQTKNISNTAINDLISGGPSNKALYPYAQLADAQGNHLAIVKDYRSTFTDTAGGGNLLDWKYRPLDELQNSDNSSKTTDNRINLAAKYTFLSSFSAEIKYQLEKASTLGKNYYNQQSYYARNLINQYTDITNGSVTTPIPVGGIIDLSNIYLTSNRLRAQLNFNKSWMNKHEVYAIAGSEIGEIVSESNTNRLYGYDDNTGLFQNVTSFNGTFPTYPSGNYLPVPNPESVSRTTDRFVSYYANVSYTYDKKYTISASGRKDKSNLFGVNTNQKGVPLYSMGLGWEISRENFYMINWLPFLKARATYGYNANINKTVTAYTTANSTSNSVYSGLPYSIIASPGNPELRWEKIRMINVGLDYSFKGNIVSGSLEYYTKKGIDLFGYSPLPSSTGFVRIFGNTANTKGSGADLVVNIKCIDHPSWKWTSNILFSRALDKVTRYNDTATGLNLLMYGSGNNGTIFPLTGKPLFAIYSYKWAGLDPIQGNPQGYLNGKLSQDYTNIISNTPIANMKYNGSSRPVVFGSFRNTLQFKQLALSLNIVYKLGYYFRKSSIAYSSLFQNWSGNKDYYKRWQYPGDEKKTNVPSVQYPPVDNNRDFFYDYSEVLIDKGDNIRLQDISMSYNINKVLTNRTLFHVQFYACINNVGILWRANKDGLDPDLFGSELPLPRSVSFGIRTNL